MLLQEIATYGYEVNPVAGIQLDKTNLSYYYVEQDQSLKIHLKICEIGNQNALNREQDHSGLSNNCHAS